MDLSIPDDHAARARQDAKTRARAKRSDEDFKWLLSGPRGRRIAWEQLESTGVFQSSFCADPHVSAFKEGQQDFGRRLLARIMGLCPELFVEMIKENEDDRSDRRDD